MANALIVCLHNAGRSQMSRALFERAADDAQGGGDVVGSACGEGRDRHAAADHFLDDARDCAVAARDGHKIGGLVERLGPVVVLGRLIAHLMTAFTDDREEPVEILFCMPARAQVVDENDAHANCWKPGSCSSEKQAYAHPHH